MNSIKSRKDFLTFGFFASGATFILSFVCLLTNIYPLLFMLVFFVSFVSCFYFSLRQQVLKQRIKDWEEYFDIPLDWQTKVEYQDWLKRNKEAVSKQLDQLSRQIMAYKLQNSKAKKNPQDILDIAVKHRDMQLAAWYFGFKS